MGRPALSLDLIARLAGRATILALETERLDNRGIWLVTLADDAYPRRLRARLVDSAPPVLYGAGSVDLLQAGGMAMVSASNADEQQSRSRRRQRRRWRGQGNRGHRRGPSIDAAAMNAAVEAGGCVVGIIAQSLERQTRSAAIRALVAEERLALVSPYGSNVPLSVGAAMGRNRLINCLADIAIVVSASHGEGGTWAGDRPA